MNVVDNPYTPGAGTPPPELAGRSEVIKQAETNILRTLRNNSAKCLVLIGLRGVGKTVLLNKITQISESEGCHTAIIEAEINHGLPELIIQQLHRLLLKLDRRKKTGDDIQKAFRLLRSFAGAFKIRFGEFEVGLNHEFATGDLSIDLTDLLLTIGEAAFKRNTAAVLLIDEMQNLSIEDLSALITALHKISQRNLPVLFFGAGLPHLAKLSGEARSYAERLFDFYHIDKLEKNDAIRAIVKPALREKVSYTKEAIEAVLTETEGYPYFLQVWGSHIWEVSDHSPITLKDVNTATRRAEKALDNGFFKIRIERLTERQLKYVLAMATSNRHPVSSTEVARSLGQSLSQAAPIRDELIKKGTVYSPKRGLIAFSVPLFKEYLHRSGQL